MKLKCLGSRLAGASTVAKLVAKKSAPLPVLQYAEIEAKDGKAYLRATDLERMLVMDLFAEVEEEGKVLIPIRRLWHFAIHEKGPVIIESKGRGVVMSDADGLANVYIQLCPPSDGMPKVECGEAQYDVGEEFIMNLARAWPFSAPEESRPVLGGVLVESDGQGKVSFAAADGFRLFMSSMKLSLPVGKWLIPRETCMLLARIMKRKQVKVGFGQNVMCFEAVTDVRVVSQLIQGNFPVYQQLMPSAPPVWTFTVSGSMLQSRVMQFGDNTVRLSKTEDGLLKMLKIQMAEDDDRYEAKMPAKMTGDGKIALDYRYVAELAGMFSELTIEVVSVMSPVKVYGDLEGVMVLNMPMFVEW